MESYGALETNVTVQQIAGALNLNISNVTSALSENVTNHVFGIYDEYIFKEREHLQAYKYIAYVMGSLIVISNLTVVISSGLILKKGQQPKSTYLLLGNVSLADTIIGLSIMFDITIKNLSGSNTNGNALCVFQIGMIACPTMVSIFSVGFIAIDRYIYILHGLYYQRWINATRVRIGIALMWLIGLTLGFMPVTGWVNPRTINDECTYYSLLPGELILFNAALSIVPIIIVLVLYSIILKKALKNVNEINAEQSIAKNNNAPSPVGSNRLRAYRGNNNSQYQHKPHKITNLDKQKHASMDGIHKVKDTTAGTSLVKSKSLDELVVRPTEDDHHSKEKKHNDDGSLQSKFSIWTIDIESSMHSVSLSTASMINNKTQYIMSHLKDLKAKRNEPRLAIGSLPAMGWTGKTFTNYRCWYITVFPSTLLIILSVIALSIITMVCVLYFLILHKAVKAVDEIRAFKETNSKVSYINKAFNPDDDKLDNITETTVTITLSTDTVTGTNCKEYEMKETRNLGGTCWKKQIRKTITKMTSRARNVDSSNPSKLKAVKTVILVTACFLGTWAPYYVAVILYVRCNMAKNGYACIPIETLTLGPLYLLGVTSSLCDPIIYAWWHPGFKRTIKKIYNKYFWSLKICRFKRDCDW